MTRKGSTARSKRSAKPEKKPSKKESAGGPRALWKGVIRIDGTQVPVRFYSATQDQTIRFRLLHRKDRQPVEQRMVHPETGEAVEHESRRKGAEVEPGLLVVLEHEELSGLEPQSSREIEVTRFVERGTLDHEWYDRPYYLGPDGDEDAYWAMVAALEESGREGIARWVMRKREHIGSLITRSGRLSLVTLRFADEVIQPEELEVKAPKRDIKTTEMQMARQLISAMEGEFEPSGYRDEFRERVADLIEKKAKGKVVHFRKPKPKEATATLADALRDSLSRARKERRA